MPTPIEVLAGNHFGTTDAHWVVKLLTEAGYAIVPIKPSERMLEELARIGDGPDISGAEVWGYMLAAAAANR